MAGRLGTVDRGQATTNFRSKPPHSSAPRSERVVAALSGALVLLSSGVAVARTSHDSPKRPATVGAHSVIAALSAPTTSKVPAVETLSAHPPAKPVAKFADGRFTRSCDYVFGNISQQPPTSDRLIAQARLHNAANAGIRARVTASWTQSVWPAITRTVVVRVPHNASQAVHFSIPVSRDKLELFASATQPTACSVRVTVVG